MKVVFVCTGNTCRSPLAEGLMKAKLEKLGLNGIEVSSAGLAAFSGDEVSQFSVTAAAQYSVDISSHRARALSPYELDEGLFFCMSPSHVNALLPFTGEERVFLLGDSIPDPYGGTQEEYNNCARLIDKALDSALLTIILKSVNVSPMQAKHTEQIAVIENLCFSVPWSKQSLDEELDNPNAHFLCAHIQEKVLGYIGVIEIAGEADITNVAVHPDFRRMKIGSLLLESAEKGAINRNCTCINLEVRESNIPAINLYSGNGYKSVGIRKNFYEKPTENAVLMTKFLNGETRNENTCY